MNNRIKRIKRYKAMLALMCWCCFFALWGACGCGEASVAWMRGGLDVEAVGKQAEVQKEQEIVVDWTLKLRGSR